MELLITCVVTIFSAGLSAWLGVYLGAKKTEKSQRELIDALKKSQPFIESISRRLPGGSAYTAVKEAEDRNAKNIAQEKADNADNS